jgi:hypothetical protein
MDSQWKVGNIQSVLLPDRAAGYGFSIQLATGRPLLNFAYATQAEAERARMLMLNAIECVVDIGPTNRP